MSPPPADPGPPGAPIPAPQAPGPWVDVAVGIALAAGIVGPAAVAGGLAASPGGEVYGHAWVQWWAAQAWPALPGGTPLVPGAADWPVIDPLPTWLAAGIARVAGPVAAWNLLYAGYIVLAAVGGGALARAVRGVGLVGALALPLAPIFLGSLRSGLTEDGAYGLLALALARLLDGRRVQGGVLLGLCAWCGLYLAWMGALAALAIAAVTWARESRAGPGPLRAARGWLVAGLAAGLLAAPALAPFATRLGGVGHRSGAPPASHEALWRVNPWRHADALSFVAPGPIAREGSLPVGADGRPALVREHPTYVGFTTLALTAAGGWSPGLLALPAAYAAALGDPVDIAGDGVGANPAAPLLAALPFGALVNHKARLWLLGQLVLTALAARGAQRWPRLAAVAVAADLVLLSPSPPPLPVTASASPAIYAQLDDLPEGPVVVEGAAGPGIPPQKVFYDQRAHGRRLLHDPNHPGPVVAPPGSVLVALGPAVAAVEARRGPPDRRTADGAAWWIPPNVGATGNGAAR